MKLLLQIFFFFSFEFIFNSSFHIFLLRFKIYIDLRLKYYYGSYFCWIFLIWSNFHFFINLIHSGNNEVSKHRSHVSIRDFFFIFYYFFYVFLIKRISMCHVIRVSRDNNSVMCHCRFMCQYLIFNLVFIYIFF